MLRSKLTAVASPLNMKIAHRLKTTLVLGIRREDKGRWERRVPVPPSAVAELRDAIAKDGVTPDVAGTSIIVQPSSRRIYSDEEYRRAGAIVDEDLSRADIIVGVKEVPVAQLIPNKTYMFFSHTHKGQQHNMGMLHEIVNKNIRLIDYELLVDEKNVRQVAFGKYAGYAGMINALHGVGHRMLTLGYSTPFVNIGRAHTYYSLNDAKAAIAAAGSRIQQFGLPRAFVPMVVTFTGSGNVASGAKEVFESLPHEYISTKDLHFRFPHDLKSDRVYAVNPHIDDFIRPNNASVKFSIEDYFKRGKSAYHSVFHKEILPYTTVLVNGIYWDDRYPRLLTNDQFEELARPGNMRVLSIADISCDIDGSLQFMDHASTIDEPFFHYDPIARKQSMKLDAPGVQVMSIDNLPAELAAEASAYFGRSLLPFVKDLVMNRSNTALNRATIAAGGELLPAHQHLEPVMVKHSSSAPKRVLLLGSGRVAQPLVDFFLAKKNVHLTIGTNNIAEGTQLGRGAANAKVVGVDVGDASSLGAAISQADLVHMVTASYLTHELEALHGAAKKAGVAILNELGLDPGIDHLLAMKFMDEVRANGGDITSFVSWCGGLPAPEVSDNPLGYKFSWSPRGVLTAALNPAKFKRDGKVVEIPLVLDAVQDVDIFKGFQFEGLANRDSLKYTKLYGLDDAKLVNMFRGTLRYKGYSSAMRAFHQLGMLDTKVSASLSSGKIKSWPGLINELIGESKSTRKQLASRLSTIDPKQAESLMSAFEWLGLLDDRTAFKVNPKAATALDTLCALLEQKLTYGPDERDMVCLHHIFGVRTRDGKEETHTSTLVAYGEPGGYTAMAKTVALPAAMGADLILSGEIAERGVIMPTHRGVYEPILRELTKSGFKFVEKRVK